MSTHVWYCAITLTSHSHTTRPSINRCSPPNISWRFVGRAWAWPCRRTHRETTGQSLTQISFYSASALLAMRSAVLARGILSVRPSVCLSVTFRYCVQTNEDTIVRFSASGRTIHLVSGAVKFIWIFAGDHPQRGCLRHPYIDRENSTNNRP